MVEAESPTPPDAMAIHFACIPIVWSHGERSWFAGEGSGLLVGDVGSSRNFTFNRA